MVADGGRRKSRKRSRGLRRKLKIQGERGEVVSESGGQIVPATSLVAMTSQLISLLVCDYRSTTRKRQSCYWPESLTAESGELLLCCQ